MIVRYVWIAAKGRTRVVFIKFKFKFQLTNPEMDNY